MRAPVSTFSQWLGLETVNLPYLYSLLLASLLGWLTSKVLKWSGQKWVGTLSNTLTFTILPVIGFVITKSISGNIALSLGMVGALSIIRFRHPVKSPFELTAYFLLVTQGIAITVAPAQAVALTVFATGLAYIYSKHSLKKSLTSDGQFKLSIDAINEASYFIYEIQSSERLPKIEESNELIYSSEDRKLSLFLYKLKVSSRSRVAAIRDELGNISTIVKSSIVAST